MSRKKSEEKVSKIWITNLDFDYAYNQIKMDEATRNLCIITITGGEFTGYYRFMKGFYGLADIPNIFQDKTLEFKHAWLDDIIIVIKDEELENARYRLHPKKCVFFKKGAEWVGHRIGQSGIRPLQDKLDAIAKVNTPKNKKVLKSFLGAIQYLSKYKENLSTQTDILRQLLKKQNEWNWTQEHPEEFNNLKKTNNTTTLPYTLQLKQREHPNDRRKYEGTRSATMAERERRKNKPIDSQADFYRILRRSMQ